MVQPLPVRGDVVRCLDEAGRPLHVREIASRLSVAPGSYDRFLELLDQLTFDRTIRRLGGSRFAPQPPEERQSRTWEGLLSVNPRGFGFVNAAGQEDVYIPPEGIGGALHGDRVEVKVVSRSSRGVEGRIERIVTRRSPRVAGLLRKKGRSAWLEPDDARLRGPIVLTAKKTEGEDGDAAVVSITRFPQFATENVEGELLAVLGRPGEAKAEVAKILVREQIVEEHPADVLTEAEAMAARLGSPSLEGRVDLRHVPLPSIDPEDARDHDDTVWVERRDDGGYRAWVAIADVSEYVREGSALDREALRRGCTIYLPDRAIPMLPSALAADLCSLLPERERLCLCVIAELDRGGAVERFEIVEGVMRSAAMLTYGGVARALGFTETGPRSKAAEAFKGGLKVVDELSRKLRKRRMDRGALDMDLPEAKLTLDEQSGAPVDVTQRTHDPGIKRAYQMVEELMLLANELVAQWLSAKRCPAIYRVHGVPDEMKLERLGEISSKLGLPLPLHEAVSPKGLSRWLDAVRKRPELQVLELLLLRSLKQAVYDVVNIGHFGLASDAYLHFTSPIRRYPDLLVHRLVKKILRGGKVDQSASFVETMRAAATDSSQRERSAVEVEREVMDLYRALFMREHLGEVFEGTVTGVSGTGLFVNLSQPYVDVLVRFEALGPDNYEIDEDELGAVGMRSGDRVRIGDRMTLEIEDVALLRRTVFGKRRLEDSQIVRITGGGRPGPSQRRAPAGARGRAPSPNPRRTERDSGRPGRAAAEHPAKGGAQSRSGAGRATGGSARKQAGRTTKKSSGYKHR